MASVNAVKEFADRLGRSKRVTRAVSRINVLLYRLSSGRFANRLAGSPICLVTMTGARSGRSLTLPLMYTEHGRDVLLVASLGGAPRHPAWYHNLKAHPQVTIQIGSRRCVMVAREATVAQRRKLWSVVVASYAAFEDYQKRTTRQIPIFVCSPRD